MNSAWIPRTEVYISDRGQICIAQTEHSLDTVIVLPQEVVPIVIQWLREALAEAQAIEMMPPPSVGQIIERIGKDLEEDDRRSAGKDEQ